MAQSWWRSDFSLGDGSGGHKPSSFPTLYNHGFPSGGSEESRALCPPRGLLGAKTPILILFLSLYSIKGHKRGRAYKGLLKGF